jgi:glycosyltransferase involved in cell wall biosynthesis
MVSRRVRTPAHLGMLELGPPEGGIARYGRRLAEEMRDRGVAVKEVRLATAAGGTGLRDVFAGLRQVRGARAVIVPYSRHRLWGPGRRGALELLLLRLAVPRPITILHDVAYPGGPRRVEWWRVGLVSRLGARPVVLSEHDQKALRRMGVRSATTIPHFIDRLELPTRAQARARLGLDSTTPVLAVIGWIHRRKGHDMAIKVLTRLPEDHILWFVGSGAADTAHLERLLALAKDAGVEDRLEVTGFLSEEDMRDRLAAMDVGLCAYADASASGSLATLLGARRPIVASDLPTSRDHASLVPDAIRVVGEANPDSYSQAVRDFLAAPPGPEAFDPILAERSPARSACALLRLSGVGGR